MSWKRSWSENLLWSFFVGECWSGPSPSGEFEYSKYGSGDDCYGPEYNLCQSDDINCVGASSHNFVYEIGKTSETVHMEKIIWPNNFVVFIIYGETFPRLPSEFTSFEVAR
jgi:hypothetical protein